MAVVKTLTSGEQTDLELLVDRVGLSSVVDALAQLCGEKAEHLRVNWQDKESAKVWNADGSKLSTIIVKLAN